MTDRDRFATAVSRVRLRLVADDRLVASIRRGDVRAFEAVYERYCAGLLSFCVYMLGSRHDAEDAVQATFASAYRALREDRRPVALRPWLFAIARNQCLNTIRRRRPTVELNGEVAPNGDPVRELELREEIRSTFDGLRGLPERQRAALVLAELHGLNHAEIGAVLDVHTTQVKAFIYQARSNLISERQAREADCQAIREELATARGAALLRGRLRRHVRSCTDCRVYADGVANQRRQLGALALIPLAPSLVFRFRALEEALGGGGDPVTYAGGVAVGGSVAGAAVEVAGGGAKALVAKVAASVACLGASAGVGVSVLEAPVNSQSTGSTAVTSSQQLADSSGVGSSGWANESATGEGAAGDAASAGNGGRDELPNGSRGRARQPRGHEQTDPRALRADPGERGGQREGRGDREQGGFGAGQPGHEGHSTKGGTPSTERDEQRRLKRLSQQSREAERTHKREDHQRKQEEHQAGGGSPTREERQVIRSKEREEREAVRAARPPPTAEQLQHKREQREKKLEEREREREESESEAP